MITRELKLKLTKNQEKELQNYLWCLTGVYNWAIRTIKLNAQDKIYLTAFDLYNLTSNHAKRIGINAQVFQNTLKQASNAWERCFKKIAKEPKLKGIRNKLKSFTFPQFNRKNLLDRSIKLPSIGEVRYHKQDIPQGNIKQVRIIKRASGWYAQLVIDAKHTFPVKDTEEIVGIDTGFKDLAILSNGKKIKNNRYYIKTQKRLAQAQRGKNKKLVARLHERTANQRKDYNHKVSRAIVQEYKEIYITNDNLKGQAKLFGKSVGDAGISQLRQFISYKSDNHNRKCVLVDSKNTTKTCHNCWNLTGPTGRDMLNVRSWVCSSCGEHLDRDINSANVILKIGLGMSLVNPEFPTIAKV